MVNEAVIRIPEADIHSKIGEVLMSLFYVVEETNKFRCLRLETGNSGVLLVKLSELTCNVQEHSCGSHGYMIMQSPDDYLLNRNKINMSTIKITDICGKEVLSRANIRKLYDYINDTVSVLDMSDITFISRSVADELCNISDKFTQISFANMSQDVEKMLTIVQNGRGVKREFASKAKVSITFNCKTMEDLRKALLSFGL